jgi:hypothetical protein
MLKRLLVTTAIGGLMMSGAIAQSPTQSSPPAEKPAATADQSKAGGAKFISAQSADQWVFSKFKGTDVLGPDNAHIGDVDDMLFDKNGKVVGFVVGVGGFLGIGQKNVAIDMNAFQVVPADTGSSGNASAMRGNTDPTNVKLKVSWTKDQLKDAPDFQYYKPASQTTSSTPPPRTSPPASR